VHITHQELTEKANHLPEKENLGSGNVRRSRDFVQAPAVLLKNKVA